MQDVRVLRLESCSVAARTRGVLLRRWQNDDKFLPAETAHKVICPNPLGERHCDFPQHSITRLVPIGVVEAFEMVQIDHEDSQRLRRSRRAPYLAFQYLLQVTAVIQTGQGIAHRLGSQRFPQPYVGNGQSNLSRKSRLERDLGWVQLRSLVGGLKVYDAQGLTLRQDRDTQVCIIGARRVRAGRRRIACQDQMRMSGAQSPA